MKNEPAEQFPYFRVSSRENTLEKVHFIFDHLCKLKVPCGIIKEVNEEEGKKTARFFSVWKLGDELKGITYDDKKPNTEIINGELIKGYGGFSKNKKVIETQVGYEL